jgi:hypothetical protein
MEATEPKLLSVDVIGPVFNGIIGIGERVGTVAAVHVRAWGAFFLGELDGVLGGGEPGKS